MKWVVLALLVALAVVLGRWLRRRRARQTAGSDLPDLSPQELTELEQGFARVEREESGILETLLAARLRVLVSRGVPLRAMRPAPGEHAARLVFANGTVLICRAERPGDLYALAIRVHREGARLASWGSGPDGTVLRFSWPEGGADLIALGLDQSD